MSRSARPSKTTSEPPRAARARWETHASEGRIPYRWIDDPTRAFLRADGGAASSPWTTHVCDEFAAGAPAVLALEELARVVASALAPWGWPAITRIAWHQRGTLPEASRVSRTLLGAPPATGAPIASEATLRGLPTAAAWAAGPAMLRAVQSAKATPAVPVVTTSLRHGNAWADALRSGAQWSAAARLELAVPAAHWPPLAGRSLAELPDPFTPLFELALAGGRWIALVPGEVRLRLGPPATRLIDRVLP